MTKRIIILLLASQDLDNHFAYIAENNVEAALHFFDSARMTIAQLAKMPEVGSLYPVSNPRLQGLRKWAVKHYRKYVWEDAIEVVRILYATQDISSILDSEG